MQWPEPTTRDKLLSAGLIAAGVGTILGPFHPPYWNLFAGAAIGAGVGSLFQRKLVGAVVGVPAILGFQLGLLYILWK